MAQPSVPVGKTDLGARRGTSLATYAGTPMPPIQDLSRAYQELVRIGLALSQETDLTTLLDRVLTEARWFTGAEAGTLYLLEGDVLQFAVVQNDRLKIGRAHV